MRHSIVCPPSPNFAAGLTTVDLGIPDYKRALAQHAAYCEALERCGLAVTRLAVDPHYPDSTFVEDTAVLTRRRAILTRPGAPSRSGEVAAIRNALSGFHREFKSISAPGTLDGGDVCEVDDHFLIGISDRTNEAGARQLAAILADDGFTSSFVDIRAVSGILHLKSGVAHVGEGTVVAVAGLAHHPELRNYDIIPVDPSENYGANCVRVNRQILIAAGHPRLEASLARTRCELIPLEMTEFQKMDGGLSCLSLRF